MASSKANMDEFDDTQTLYAPQLELKTDGGLSTLYLMDPILIDVTGEINEGSFGEPTEIEKQDKEMIERWKDEADTNLVFVCAGSTIVYIITF